MSIKKLLLLLLFVPFSLYGANYYIDTAGDDDTGNGSTGNPWASVEYAMNQCSGGDTVFAKSGTYSFDNEQTITVSGTSDNYIVLTSEKGHPDSVIFDFWDYDVSGNPPGSIYGIRASEKKCLKFEKFTLRRLWKINTDNGRAHGFYFGNCDSIDINWVQIDSIAGRGILGYKCGAANIANCDFSWLADPQDADPGNAGTGILWYQTTASPADTVRITGCRGWKCADQAFGLVTGNVTIYDSCWAWDNGIAGYTSGGGHGFKTGLGYATDIDTLHVVIKHCISAFNDNYGFNTNTSAGGYKYNIHFLCNTSYGNGNWGMFADSYTYWADNNIRYYNNLSFDNGNGWDLAIGDTATHYNNSFDYPYTGTGIGNYFNSPATVTIADFQDVPEDAAECNTVLGADRKGGGHLPDIGDYFKPASASDLIDQGLVIKDEAGEMAYSGSAPDFGAFEYVAPGAAEAAVTLIAVTSGSARKATVEGNVTDDGGGTVSARGVTWDTSTNPDIGDDSFTASGSGTGTYSIEVTGLLPSTTYYFRCYATNGAGTAYSDNYTLETPAKSVLSSGDKWLVRDGKIIEY